MHLRKLRLTNLGPFDEIEFEFDAHVNVFTGPNNSGKSTVLVALGDIALFPFYFPEKLLRKKRAEFKVELGPDGRVFEHHFPIDLGEFDDIVELMTSIGYSTFVPAMRLSTDFRAKAPIVTKQRDDSRDHTQQRLRSQDPLFGDTSDDSAENDEELRTRRRLIPTDASSVSDKDVVQKIIELDYRAYRTGNNAIRKIIDKTAAIASEVTDGYPIRFVRVDEDENGLFPQFETPDGPVPLNVLSQGTQSLVQWLARLLIDMAEYHNYPEDIENKNGVLIIDEIDAHLHPSWQRRIIPALARHFQNLQIFCSSHSPLMLAGLKAGQVQLLKRDEAGKVTVSRNDQDIVGWSADEILRGFLDVPSPTDLETVRNLARLEELQEIDSPTDEQAKELQFLRESVRRDLIGGPLAVQLDELRSILNDAKSGSVPDNASA